MTRKLLPLPVGGAAPTGSSIRPWQQFGFRSRLDSGTLLVGLVLAGVGAWLGLHPDPVQVGTDATGYHVGSTTLLPVDQDRYSGDLAIVVRHENSRLRAAAAGKLGGRWMQGTCLLPANSDTEECVFWLGGHRYRAHDRLRAGRWQRTYDDGLEVEFRVVDPRRPAPVPVPLGR